LRVSQTDRFTFTETADINQWYGVTAINTSDKLGLGCRSRKAAFCFTEPSVAICRVATNQIQSKMAAYFAIKYDESLNGKLKQILLKLIGWKFKETSP
jgi:hypothetical protein